MDNITRLKAQAAVNAVLVLLNELDRVHSLGFTRHFVEEHRDAINAALKTIEEALEIRNPNKWL